MSGRIQKEFFDQVMYGNLEEVKKLLKHPSVQINQKGEHGTALEIACWYSHDALVELLVEHGADVKDKVAFQNAVLTMNGQSHKLIRFLAAKGADVNQDCNLQSDLEGASLLMGAISSGYVDTAYVLLELGADTHHVSENGWTAFTWCAMNNMQKLGAELVRRGFDGPFFDEDDEQFYQLLSTQQEFHDNYIETSFSLSYTDEVTPHSSGNPDLSSVFKGDRVIAECTNSPIHLLTLDLSVIEEFPRAIRDCGKIHVIFNNCQAHDDPDYMDLKILPDGRVELIEEEPYDDSDEDEDSEDESEEASQDGSDDDETMNEDSSDEDTNEEDPDDSSNEDTEQEVEPCDPEDVSLPTSITYLTRNDGESDDSDAFQIGGLPEWLQTPSWGCCAVCGKSSFYIGTIQQFYAPPGCGGPGNHLYIFVCPEHKTIDIVRQMT